MSRISSLIKILWELDWKSAWIHSPSQLHTDSQEQPLPQSFRNFLEGSISYSTHRSVFQLGLLAKVKGYLSPADSEQVTRAFIALQLDYCNSLHVSIDCSLLHRLQPGQNSSARLVTRTLEHASLQFWLPVHFGIILKALLMVFKTSHGMEAMVFIQPFTLLCSQKMVGMSQSAPACGPSDQATEPLVWLLLDSGIASHKICSDPRGV